MASIQAVTQDSFQAEVLDADIPVLVDFWASWCQPCLRMNPVLEDLSEQFSGRAKIVKINVDEQRALAAQFQIMSIPTFYIYKNGEKVTELDGTQIPEELAISLEEFCE